MDALAKPEEKQSSPELMWANDFTFISSYSMDECIVQLNLLRTKYQEQEEHPLFLTRGSINFETLTDNGGVVHFEIKAGVNRQIIELRLIGQLIYKDYNRTLVRTHIGVTRKSIVLELITTILLCLLFTLAYMTTGALVVVMAVIIINHLIIYVSVLSLKSKLRESIHEALRKPKAPRPTTLPL